ncbi:trypsin-like peptidase domain-containing protein [Patescibacteria group bacterium]|nr:trypsin-like peptidase domain-containing protein [Patescibacteria group bacterium]
MQKWLANFGWGVLGGLVGGLALVLLWGNGQLSWLQAPANNSAAIDNTTTTTNNSTGGTVNDTSVEDVVAKVSPAVASITYTNQVTGFFGGTYEQTGSGTGFIIRNNGLIVTNRHVASADAKYTVTTSSGKTYDATVVARDAFNDLAVLKISASNLPVATLGDSSKLRVGQQVVAIGNALGQYQNTVTTGIISGIGRAITAGGGSGGSEQIDNVIQTDAAINPGNSGGPLVNLAGEVIGINTAIDIQGQSIGFAIPINDVKSSIEAVAAGGKISRPMLGIRYMTITPELAAANHMSVDKGAIVTRGANASEFAVTPGGPADKAGIKENDIITVLDGKTIDESVTIPSVLKLHKPGDVIKVKLLRGGKTMEVSVTLGEMK